MKIRYSIDEITKCFDFSIRYHLAENKSNCNRTTGQNRGLGAILNDFIYGKVVETGVIKAIESFNDKIKCGLDFDIHPINSTNISDPDIIKVIDSECERSPRIFIEIKYHSETDRWLGLTHEQFLTIKNNKKYNQFYIIYASLHSEDNLNDDLLGMYLRQHIDNDYLKNFSSIDSFFLKIDRILSFEILEKYGIEFKAGRFLLETEIFYQIPEISAKYYIDRGRQIEVNPGALPVIMSNKISPVKEYGEFSIDGKYELWLKENPSSNKYLIRTHTKCIVTSEVLGTFILDPGMFYLILFCTVGRDPILKRNNIWIANRNIYKIQQQTTEEILQKIAFEI